MYIFRIHCILIASLYILLIFLIFGPWIGANLKFRFLDYAMCLMTTMILLWLPSLLVSIYLLQVCAYITFIQYTLAALASKVNNLTQVPLYNLWFVNVEISEFPFQFSRIARAPIYSANLMWIVDDKKWEQSQAFLLLFIFKIKR